MKSAKALSLEQKGLAIYHVVSADEDFDHAAEILFQLVKQAATEHPGKPRYLYLDIDGHRNHEGGYDHDMFELQHHFILDFLSTWLTEISLPIMRGERIVKPSQREDVPTHLGIYQGGNPDERAALVEKLSKEAKVPLFDADTGDVVHPDGTREPRPEA